jgi:hypothetical protein
MSRRDDEKRWGGHAHQLDVAPHEPDRAPPPLLPSAPVLDGAAYPEGGPRVGRGGGEVDEEVVAARALEEDGVGRAGDPPAAVLPERLEAVQVVQRHRPEYRDRASAFLGFGGAGGFGWGVGGADEVNVVVVAVPPVPELCGDKGEYACCLYL